MMFTDPNGTMAPCITTFEAEIMQGTTKSTTEKLFYSIEPTLYTEMVITALWDLHFPIHLGCLW
jgi:hypothetical protein